MNFKIIIIVIFLITVIGGAFYISLREDTEVLVVEVTLAMPPGNDSAQIISNISAYISYVKRMEVPEETPLSTPGITVLLIQNMQEISGWYSVPIPVNESIYGSYRIEVKPFDKIDRSQPVRILTRVVDPNGKDISVIAKDIKLE